MPVTARLSRRFYETFGEEIANELVDWFNAVDLTYRADLRELNELNFARFDAKLEQRVAGLAATVETRFAALETRVDHGFAAHAAQMDAKLQAMRAELIKWMFLFWIGSVGLVLGINALG